VKKIHQGNLTAEEEIKEKTGNTIIKQEYLNLWAQEG